MREIPNLLEFRRWLESVESGAHEVQGLLHCSLEHRAALRAAFEAGRKVGRDG